MLCESFFGRFLLLARGLARVFEQFLELGFKLVKLPLEALVLDLVLLVLLLHFGDLVVQLDHWLQLRIQHNVRLEFFSDAARLHIQFQHLPLGRALRGLTYTLCALVDFGVGTLLLSTIFRCWQIN